MKRSTQIRDKVISLLSKLPEFANNPSIGCSFNDSPPGDMPYFHVEGDAYYYDYYERGQCYQSRSTQNEDEAVYWLLYDKIHQYAFGYELKHRKRYVDSRRIAFQKATDLYCMIGQPYLGMWHQYLNDLLDRAPYDDKNALLLDLVWDYEELASEILKLNLTLTPTAQKALASVTDRHFREPSGGMANPNWSLLQMKNAVDKVCTDNAFRESNKSRDIAAKVVFCSQLYENLSF